MTEEKIASQAEVKEFQTNLLMLELEEIAQLFEEDTVESIEFWLTGADMALLEASLESFLIEERYMVCAMIRDKINLIYLRD